MSLSFERFQIVEKIDISKGQIVLKEAGFTLDELFAFSQYFSPKNLLTSEAISKAFDMDEISGMSFEKDGKGRMLNKNLLNKLSESGLFKEGKINISSVADKISYVNILRDMINLDDKSTRSFLAMSMKDAGIKDILSYQKGKELTEVDAIGISVSNASFNEYSKLFDLSLNHNKDEFNEYISTRGDGEYRKEIATFIQDYASKIDDKQKKLKNEFGTVISVNREEHSTVIAQVGESFIPMRLTSDETNMSIINLGSGNKTYNNNIKFGGEILNTEGKPFVGLLNDAFLQYGGEDLKVISKAYYEAKEGKETIKPEAIDSAFKNIQSYFADVLRKSSVGDFKTEEDFNKIIEENTTYKDVFANDIVGEEGHIPLNFAKGMVEKIKTMLTKLAYINNNGLNLTTENTEYLKGQMNGYPIAMENLEKFNKSVYPTQGDGKDKIKHNVAVLYHPQSTLVSLTNIGVNSKEYFNPVLKLAISDAGVPQGFLKVGTVNKFSNPLAQALIDVKENEENEISLKNLKTKLSKALSLKIDDVKDSNLGLDELKEVIFALSNDKDKNCTTIGLSDVEKVDEAIKVINNLEESKEPSIKETLKSIKFMENHKEIAEKAQAISSLGTGFIYKVISKMKEENLSVLAEGDEMVELLEKLGEITYHDKKEDADIPVSENPVFTAKVISMFEVIKAIGVEGLNLKANLDETFETNYTNKKDVSTTFVGLDALKILAKPLATKEYDSKAKKENISEDMLSLREGDTSSFATIEYTAPSFDKERFVEIQKTIKEKEEIQKANFVKVISLNSTNVEEVAIETGIDLSDINFDNPKEVEEAKEKIVDAKIKKEEEEAIPEAKQRGGEGSKEIESEANAETNAKTPSIDNFDIDTMGDIEKGETIADLTIKRAKAMPTEEDEVQEMEAPVVSMI